jgi:ribose transport system permease protein
MTRILFAQLPLVMLLGLVVAFSLASPRFFTVQNGLNVLVQASSGMILAAGMTWVLVTSGVDLSVGSLMFLCAAVCGKLIQNQFSPLTAAAAALGVGPLCGLAHGLLVTRGRMSPFIVTLASLFLLRGAGLWISRTRAMNLPDVFARLASQTWLGIPMPVWVAAATVGSLHLLQTRTAFGRQAYAIGYDPVAARKAGVRVDRVLLGVYALSGACAAIAAMTSLAQLGAVSPTFGKDREFEAIAAAVLGGASLFGGRGNVLPGAVTGAMLVALVFNGLNLMNANPYVYPLLTAGVVLLAVLFDSLRQRDRSRSMRRGIALRGGAR